MKEQQDPVSALLRLSGPDEQAPDNVTQRVLASTERAWRQAVFRRRLRLAAGVGLLSAASLLLATTVWQGSRWGEDSPLADVEKVVGPVEVDSLGGRDLSAGRLTLGPGSVLETRSEGGASIRLRQGARIRLSSNSRLKVVGAQRFVLEAGALYFDSGTSGTGAAGAQTPDARRPEGQGPVTIRTRYAELSNLGTGYEARLTEGALEVAVRSGRVLVDTEGRKPDHAVQRGQLLRLGSDGEAQVQSLSPTDARFAWTRPLATPFAIDGRSLGEFLDWVERETGLEVRLGAGVDRRLSQVRLVGDITWTEPESAIQPTLRLVGFSAQRGDDTLTVLPLP